MRGGEVLTSCFLTIVLDDCFDGRQGMCGGMTSSVSISPRLQIKLRELVDWRREEKEFSIRKRLIQLIWRLFN